MGALPVTSSLFFNFLLDKNILQVKKCENSCSHCYQRYGDSNIANHLQAKHHWFTEHWRSGTEQDGEVCEVVAVTDSPGGGGETSVLGTSSL